MADALTIVEQDRTRQSRTAPRLNRAVRSLKGLWIPGINPAYGGGPVGSPVGIATVLVNGRLAGNFDGSTSRIELPLNLIDNARHTIMVGAVQVTLAGLHYMVGADYNHGGDNVEHYSLRNNAGNIDLAYYNGTGYAASVASPAFGSYNVYFGLLGAGGVTDNWQVGYVDRVGVETLSSTTSVPAASRAGKRAWIGCGANAGSPWRHWNTQISFVAIFGRWLTPAERRLYALNPWLLQEPDEEPVFYSLPSGGASLVIADATHGHLADNFALTQAHQLALADATHGHLADGISLTQQHQLAVANATHAHAADDVTLAVQHVLAILDATHAHTADNVTLQLAGTLAIDDATHGHTAANVVLTQAHLLAIADALHAHGADNLVLSVSSGITLAIQDALHAHGAGNVALTQVHALVVSDALHAHLAQSLTLALPGAAIDHNRLLLIRAEDRILVIAAESRLWNIPAEDRILIVH